MRRSRLAATAAVALACGLAPSLPPASGAPGAWTATLPASGAWDNLSAFPDGTAYATVGLVTAATTALVPDSVPVPRLTASSTGYFKSTDYGRTWRPMTPPAVLGGGTYNLHVRFATPQVGYATYSSRTSAADPTGRVTKALCLRVTHTFRTLDGGATWTPLCEPHGAGGGVVSPGVSPLAVGAVGGAVLLLGEETVPAGTACDGDTVTRAVVHLSGNGGETWTRGALPKGYTAGWTAKVYDRRTALVSAYRVTYAPDCSARGDANALFLTTDGGRTYRKVLDCAKQPLCTAATFVSRNRILVGRTDGSTLVTDDGGRRWRAGQRLWDPVNDAGAAATPDRKWWHWVQSFSFADGRNGYASTRGSGTWRTADGGRSWTQERSHECAYWPYGVGENATATADAAITGGPVWFSARLAAPADPGPCTPEQSNVPVPGVVASAGAVAAYADATVALRP